ncbi:type II secretion system F family protein [Aeromicrobium fastidiosum]|uniref:Type II secretion system F family protein n=1 Tax=Aeromicrobium fastidiosum TaxID=52699 RepID=A0A641AQB9_9ACTN|nr:type II secretion system F family protein [Aeromicrobium fastidiosum]KAA1378292.1 type II secretion system F family protein [Aeromicrobium fastidiosum]MBP2388889.1 tight adherence protein C [Aeromicrobium fastidiosum]
MTGALMGFGFSAGMLLAVSGWLRARRPTLEQRVLPYIRDVHPQLPSLVRSTTAVEAVFGPSVRRAGEMVGDVLGGSASVARRLTRLGSAMTVDEFRVRQVLWGAAGLGGGVAVSTVLWSSGRASAPILLVVCAMSFVAGVLFCDQNLSSRVTARERDMQAEFPVVADLLALAVAAGESPVAGLDRIMQVCHGALADELGGVIADVRTGTPIADAFDALAARTGVTSIARFAEGLAIAVERGTPLVDVLHAQAADVRESGRRELIEAGGRKEVTMMIPVVFLILPVTVVFAFFPGFVGLHLTSGT